MINAVSNVLLSHSVKTLPNNRFSWCLCAINYSVGLDCFEVLLNFSKNHLDGIVFWTITCIENELKAQRFHLLTSLFANVDAQLVHKDSHSNFTETLSQDS